MLESIFWVIALVFLFGGLGVRELWGSEGRWAEVTREMLRSGDFFHPAINGRPYFDKPLLGYWFVAIFSFVTGNLSEWAVRAPSAVSGLVCLWSTSYLGRKLWSKEIGRTASWMLLGSYGFLLYSRMGMSDMENVAAILLAVSWYWAHRGKQSFFTFLVFYLIGFLGSHTKGLTASLIPVLVILPDLIRGGRWKACLTASHALALLLGLVVYFTPFVYADVTSGGYKSSGIALVIRENIIRFVQPFDHKGHFYDYFFYVPLLFLPWTLLLLPACGKIYSSLRAPYQNTRWLAEATILIFCFFTASGSRRSYYILPILPFCALMISVFLYSEGHFRWIRIGLGTTRTLLLAIGTIAVISPLALLFIQANRGIPISPGLMVGLSVLGFLSLAPFVVERFYPGLPGRIMGCGHRVAPLLLTGVILMGGYFSFVRPHLDAYRWNREFSQDVKDVIRSVGAEHVQIVSYGKSLSSNMLFNISYPEPIVSLKDSETVSEFLSSDEKIKILISKSDRLGELSSLNPTVFGEEPTIRENVNPWDQESSNFFVAWVIRDKE